MTQNDLRLLILADSQALVLAKAGDDTACAARCLQIAPREIAAGTRLTERGLLKLFTDPAAGEACLEKIEAAAAVNPLVQRIIGWVKPPADGIDLGDSDIRSSIDALCAAGVLTTVERDTLKSGGERQSAISAQDVSAAVARHRTDGKAGENNWSDA